MKKRIVIDISQVVYTATGSAKYVQDLLEASLSITDYDFIYFSTYWRSKMPEEILQKIKSAKARLIEVKLPISFAEFLGNRLHYPYLESLLGCNFDLYFSSDWIQFPSRAKKITQVHDVIFASNPELFPKKIIEVQERRFEQIINDEVYILASSKYSIQSIKKYFPKINHDNIHLLYPPFVKSNLIAKNTDELIITNPFILYVGKIQERKNVKRLINAFSDMQMNNIELLIVGDKSWSEIDESILPKNIRLIGKVSDQTLEFLYQRALLFCFPSFLEGFGYPVIEAMSHGIPVTCADASSLAELASNGAALLHDPFDESSIKNALTKLINDPKLRDNYKVQGLKKIEEFQPLAYKQKLLEIFDKIL